MESMMTFISILFITFGILQIILFFKLWGMTNNIKDIKTLLINKNKIYESNADKLDGKEKSSIIPETNLTPNNEWWNEVTDEERNNAKNIIPTLVNGEVIIKLSKDNHMIVYKLDDIHELADEDYKIIYYK